MLNNLKKPIVLVFLGNYLPGFKAGGIIRSVENTINHLGGEFEFLVVTRDRDLGDSRPYPGITTNQWQQVGKAKVYYLDSNSETLKHVRYILNTIKHDVLYLNSCFDYLTISVLINRNLQRTNKIPVVITPRGEFAWASLSQKYTKKYVFILLAKIFGLYRDVIWHASSKFEANDIMDIMKIDADMIRIAFDFPTKQEALVTSCQNCRELSGEEQLRVVFLSRISPEKNLDYALRILGAVTAKVKFDIYGTIENEVYWKKCQQLINELPVNIKVHYGGNVPHCDVIPTLGKYDLFLFPSGGEAYGHVIAEALSSGTQVLISTNTPWRNLAEQGLGWDIDLRDQKSFVSVIENLASQNDEDLLSSRTLIKTKIDEILLNSEVVEANRRLFRPID